MTTRVRALLSLGLFSVVVVALLVGLGVWQLQRLAWKEALIAMTRANATAPPVAPPAEAEWPTLDAATLEYRHVKVEGVFETGATVFLFTPEPLHPRPGHDGPGYLVMTPLALNDGSRILVDRGYIAAERQPDFLRDDALSGAEAPSVVIGLIRLSEPRRWFSPHDDLFKRLWFTRDIAGIAAAQRLERVAPFSIDADATGDQNAVPEPGQARLNFPNDHLQYAVTWFGLALVWAGAYAAFAWTTLKMENAGPGGR